MKRWNHLIFSFLFGAIITALVISVPEVTYAEQNSPDSFGLQTVGQEISVPSQTTDIRFVIVRIINIFLGFLGIIAVSIVLYGGYLYMTSRGDEEQVAGAKKLLINGAIGLVIIMSAFAITSFVLRSLKSAIDGGEGVEDDPDLPGSCFDVDSPYYQQNQVWCDGVCESNPIQCSSAKYFIVKSITPHTPEQNDFIDMNNAVIRVLFSKSVETGRDASQIFSIVNRTTGETITGKFDFSFSENRTLVIARYHEGSVCATTEDVDMKCLPNGEYEIRVDDSIEDIDGRKLTTRISAFNQTFPLEAVFKTGDLGTNPVIDDTFDLLTPISINGQSGDVIYSIVQGASDTTFETTLRDQNGNSYAHFRIFREGATSTTLGEYLSGPPISQGSSKAFDFVYHTRITLTPGRVYVAEVVAHDIDGNTMTRQVRFRTVPPTCVNNELDPGETDIDEGGLCGSTQGNSCTSDSSCARWLKCLDASYNSCSNGASCTCKAVPYISKVEYMNGASGNWITIQGKNFGSSAGEIKFNYDLNSDNVIDSSVTASLAQCREGAMWNNSWIIAEVPKQIEGAPVSPSISVKNTQLADSVGESAMVSMPGLSVSNVLSLGMEESGGSTVIDASSRGNNGYINGSVEYRSDGRVGDAFAFTVDGDSDPSLVTQSGGVRIPVSQNSSLDLQQGSVFAWIKKNSLPIYYDGIVVNQGNYGMFINEQNKFAVYDWNGGGEDRWISSEINVSDGKWHYVGFTFKSGEEGGTKLYVDGRVVKSDKIYVAGGAGSLVIGAGTNDVSSQFFTGSIDEVGVWNKILSEEDVQSLYSAYIHPKFTDFTNDSFGPNLGTFTYNNIGRPGLCRVSVTNAFSMTLPDGTVRQVNVGDTAAPEGVEVTVEGKGFGTSEGVVAFGSLNGRVGTWSEDVIASFVPYGAEGEVSVYVVGDNSVERSNSVPFTVLSTANLNVPTITSVDPSSVTRGSYITITGIGFGSEGNVFFSKTEGAACPIGGCIPAGSLPQSCGDTWSNTQIIAKVPNDPQFELGEYFVVVVRNDNNTLARSSGKESVTVVSGSPTPSICRIDPPRGQAPIIGEGGVTLYGENFISNSEVKFWFPLAQASDPESWLSSASGNVSGGTSIETGIPYDTNSGLSMSSGPIKVKNGSNLLSNSIHYEVLDCREPGSPQISGFHCCSEGPEAGKWKHGNFSCEGGSREAGYVWRFTSGKIPKKFFVIEQCSEELLPSPSPSTLWQDGKQSCINADLKVRFNLPFDFSTIVSNPDVGDIVNTAIAVCGGDASQIDCGTDEEIVTAQFKGTEFNPYTIAFSKKDENNKNLDANTWYRVGLSSNIASTRFEEELGQTQQKVEKLEATKSCKIGGVTYAYCFDFRTGSTDFMCTLTGIGIDPPEYKTTLLGIVQDPRSHRVSDLDRVFDLLAVRPLVYGGFGKSNLACTTLNVDNKPWMWGPTTNAPATGAHLSGRLNSKGYATAWQNNPEGSPITAEVTENNEVFKAESILKIDLGSPYAKNVWPSCLEACVNAEIGIEFNQLMDSRTFDPSKVVLRECTNETCTHTVGSAIALSITPDLQSNTILRAHPTSPLKNKTWYVVNLEEGIYAVGGVTPAGVIKPGSSALLKQWKFRTKDSAQLCLAESVRISPDPFYSTFIGEAELYRALPTGSPDSCSPYGQQLNPWDYGWSWNVEDTAVAKVSNFSFAGSSKSSCTIGCTPKGSDISLEENQLFENNYPVCGNGIQESGEDCDIAFGGEKPGISCTFSCLRPGNPNAGLQSLQCGNGVVDTSAGEECDPKDPRAVAQYCTNMCVFAGSSPETTGNVAAPVCASGKVTYGEDCDTEDPLTQYRCSNKCLNLGTSIAQSWCDGWLRWRRNLSGVSPAAALQYAEVSQSEFDLVCRDATSVCGNRIIEQGEECDTDSAQCSSRCLIQNACDTAAAQCTAGAPGCLNDCTYAGSSVTYSSASICGDGNVGIGEYGGNPETDVLSCELPASQATNYLGQNPVQIVTSVGDVESPQSGVISDIKTHVIATVDRTNNQDTGDPITITGVSGSGEYHLQCGYTEYDSQSGDGLYNNCPANTLNNFGVASNSCCVERPLRVGEYPPANAGLGASAPVCRNTYISVTFNKNIPIQNIQDNIEVVQSFDPTYSCTEHGGTDVTRDMKDLLALNDRGNSLPEHGNLWVRIWGSIKTFFTRLIRLTVFAAPQPNQTLSPNVVWCSGITPFEIKPTHETNEEGVITQTVVSLYVGQAFEMNQYVVVLLNGGKSGIKNTAGVSIKSPFGPDLSDYWVFRTGDTVCKIREITVEPSGALFTVPNSSKSFIASALSTNEDQKIVSIPGQYEWIWGWGPQGDNIFDIPSISDAPNLITSKGVRGHTDGVVSAAVVADMSETDNQEGKIFNTIVSLDALFCQRPWPASGVDVPQGVVSTTALFIDPKYNFSMYYCADSGNALTEADDLPYFHHVEIITDPAELGAVFTDQLPDALRRYLLFADKTDDAIGVQIFANPTKNGKRQTLDEWYIEKFADLSAVKRASIGGYDALINDFNVYINAFNIDGNSIYNNVYLFSIDTNVTQGTKQAFQQLINSLRFNINLTNHNRCLTSDTPDHMHTVRETPNEFNSTLFCTTDFDCRETSGVPKSNTNGICSNAATKFSRDMQRLEQLHDTEEQTDSLID